MRGCVTIALIIVWAVAGVYGMYIFLTTVAMLEPWLAVVLTAMLLIITWMSGDD